MKKLLVLFIGILLMSCVDSSNNESLSKINELEQIIESQSLLMSQPIEANQLPAEFRAIELIDEERFKNAYTTVDIINATRESSADYDRLLNKLYQELLSKTQKEDLEIVKQAQRNWIQFRDSEIKLNNLLSESPYSGGTIQSIINGSNYLDIIKERALQIYYHKERIEN